MTAPRRRAFALAVLVCALPAPALSCDLTLDERVDAQIAIERVLQSHRLGSTRSLAASLPRAVMEAKVRRYLAASAALGA